MKITVCCWCLAPVKVRDTFDELINRIACSRGCHDAEILFNIHFSDEEINRRNHYIKLTRGEDDGET